MKRISVLFLGLSAMFTANTQAQIDTSQRYLLKTMFRGEGECLEGNRFSPQSTLGGASFMSSCRPFSGQIFRFQESGYAGYFLPKSWQVLQP